MRTPLIVALALCPLAGAVLAQTEPKTEPPSSSSPTSTMKKGKIKSGEVGAKAPTSAGDKRAQFLTMCLKLWEPATHMSRREWDSACRRSAERHKEIEKEIEGK
jgi:hypothetical protein